MDVLKSKSFWSSVMVILVMVLTNFLPQLKGIENELISSLTVIAVALVAGHKGKDVLVAAIEAMVKRASVEDQVFKMGDPVSPEAATVEIKKKNSVI